MPEYMRNPVRFSSDSAQPPNVKRAPCGKPFVKGHTMGKGKKVGRGKGMVVRTDAEVAASIAEGLALLEAAKRMRRRS